MQDVNENNRINGLSNDNINRIDPLKKLDSQQSNPEFLVISDAYLIDHTEGENIYK